MQIQLNQFGKNTKGYDNYMLLVPKDKRESKNHIEHPRTPDPYEKYSKRAFDGISFTYFLIYLLTHLLAF